MSAHQPPLLDVDKINDGLPVWNVGSMELQSNPGPIDYVTYASIQENKEGNVTLWSKALSASTPATMPDNNFDEDWKTQRSDWAAGRHHLRTKIFTRAACDEQRRLHDNHIEHQLSKDVCGGNIRRVFVVGLGSLFRFYDPVGSIRTIRQYGLVWEIVRLLDFTINKDTPLVIPQPF